MRKLLGAALAAALALTLSAPPGLAQTTGTYTSPNGQTHESQGVELIGKNGGGQRCIVGVDAGCTLATSGGGSAGGGENQPAGVSVPVTVTTYSPGQSLGGLVTVSSGGSGVLDFLALRSVDGVTGTVADYIFSRNPTSSTCSDTSAFVLGSADRPYLVGGAPIQLVFSASGIGSADTASYAQVQSQTLNFVQQDSPAGAVLYHCLVTEGSVTIATASGLRLFQGNTQG